MSDKVLLVSMPWQPYYLASTQLATLKAYLSQEGQRDIEAAHWYLEIAYELGLDTFNRISKPHLDYGEALYSYLCFPQMREEILNDEVLAAHIDAVQQSSEDPPSRLRLRWNKAFFREFRALHRKLFARYDFREYALVGFTLNYGQTVASLYAAREIKRQNPECKIIVGGAEGTGAVGASLVKHFDAFDYACNGEGERPLLELVKRLRRAPAPAASSEIGRIKGLISRHDDGEVRINAPDQVSDLSTLPLPDYDEYFELIDRLDDLSRDEVTTSIPLEGSRGCYHACTFCALTAQWEGFRGFGAEQVSRSMKALSSRYRLLEFFFVDNITPTNCEEMFGRVAESGRDYAFFYEARANLPRRTLETMKRAGLQRVQIGIEALSTSMLRKFRKKARVIHNVQAMKNCEELEILMSANLITNHFLTTQEDIDETIDVIDYCTAYFPPNGLSEFALVVGAPDYELGEERGYTVIGNASFYHRNWPPDLVRKLVLPIKEFAPHAEPVDWSGVTARVDAWKQAYAAFKRENPTNQKMLCYFDGGDFLRIEDFRPGLEGTHTLEAIEREVYLFSTQVRHLTEFKACFAQLRSGELLDIIESFVERKLMFREGDLLLSLAMTPTPRLAPHPRRSVRRQPQRSLQLPVRN